MFLQRNSPVHVGRLIVDLLRRSALWQLEPSLEPRNSLDPVLEQNFVIESGAKKLELGEKQIDWNGSG